MKQTMTMSKQVPRLLFCVVAAISGLLGCAGGGNSGSSGNGTPVPQPQPVNAAPTIPFSAQPASIFLRQSSSLSWYTTHTNKVSISHLGDYPEVGYSSTSTTTSPIYAT